MPDMRRSVLALLVLGTAVMAWDAPHVLAADATSHQPTALTTAGTFHNAESLLSASTPTSTSTKKKKNNKVTADPSATNDSSDDSAITTPAPSFSSSPALPAGTVGPASSATRTPEETTSPSTIPAEAASVTRAPSTTAASSSSSSAGSRTATRSQCGSLNTITTDCGQACPNNVVCVKYRGDGTCKADAEDSTCVVGSGPCTFECLKGTSASFDEWYIAPFGVPQWDPARREPSQIEAIGRLTIPRNITRVSFRFAVDSAVGANDVPKGRVAEVAFPDDEIVPKDAALTTLGLVNVNGRSFPSSLFAPQLQTLVLKNCLLRSVPSSVLKLRQLVFLGLQQNEIQALPKAITALPLDTLYLGENAIHDFPEHVTTIPSLKILSLERNRIDEVSVVAKESALEQLVLDYNSLTEFDAVFPSLKELFLSGNRLSAFPKSIRSLPWLEVLDMSENQLSSEAILSAITEKKVYHPKLKELLLCSSKLSALPDFSDVFPVLSKLSLKNNSIESVSGSFNGKIESLDLQSNGMKTFSGSFMRLKSLILAMNELRELPLPDKISPSLEALNVSFNRISSVNQEKELPTLRSLNISNNQMESFTMRLPNMRSLDLSKNSLTTIPDCIWSFTSLEELYLDGNINLKPLTFSREQAAFLKRLSKLTIPRSATSIADCPKLAQMEVHEMTICVTEASQNVLSTSSGGGGSARWTWVALICCVAAVALVASGIFVVYQRRKNVEEEEEDLDWSMDSAPKRGLHKTTDMTAGLTSSMEHTGGSRSHGLGIWDDEDLLKWRVDFDSIRLDQKIASGAHGEIWLGGYRSDCVAVKRLTDLGSRDNASLSYFIAEIKLLSQLDHPRVIRFYGVAWTSLTDLCAVMEFMPGGDVFSLLRTDALPRDGWNYGKLQIAMDIIEALTYVHTLDQKLIHRDLKSRNVLLDEDQRAKLTDFGISRYRDAHETMTGAIGTGRWMAPEVILGRPDYDEKVDIYSFGVILSELDTHQMPYSSPDRPGHQVSEVGILQQVASGELKPSFLSSCPPSVHEIALKCLRFRPEDRPSSLEVAYWLRRLAPTFGDSTLDAGIYYDQDDDTPILIQRAEGSEVVVSASSSSNSEGFTL